MEKRYNSFVGYFKEKYGCRLQKIVVDAGFTCPNRDGSKGLGGCTFCNNDAFQPNYSTPDKSIFQQLEEGIEFHLNRYRKTEDYLAYFQSYSNTYASLERLRACYDEALAHPLVAGIVVGTRPDCVDAEKLDYFASLAPDCVKVKITPMHGGQGYVCPIDIPAYKAAEHGFEVAFGKRPLAARRGGSIPIISSFEQILGVKTILMGFGLEKNAIHSPNESMDLEVWENGIVAVTEFYKSLPLTSNL